MFINTFTSWGSYCPCGDRQIGRYSTHTSTHYVWAVPSLVTRV